MSALERNARLWQDLYAAGHNDLRYPSEMLVRLAARLLPPTPALDVLDFGCGTGANLAHLAGMGHRLQGVEVAAAALERAASRLRSAGIEAGLQLVEPGAALPFADGAFDAVLAWQVLYYNDRAGWRAALAELERVLRPGGLMLIATAAPGDISQVQALPLGDGVYHSQVPGQETCTLTIPSADELPALFPGRQLEVGEFSSRYAGLRSRHWIVTYRT